MSAKNPENLDVGEALRASELRYRGLFESAKDGNDSVKQAVGIAEGVIGECIAASRSLTAELNPQILHEAGLNAGLEWLAGWMADKQGFSVNLNMEAIGPLPEVTKIMLFDLVRELLFNAVKHSHTRSANVSLGTADGFLRLVVSDRECGFDPLAILLEGKSGSGFGLFSICERLELIGGQFEMESALGEGSRFVLSVPVTKPVAVRPASNLLPRLALGAENIAHTMRRSIRRKMPLLQR